MAEPAAAQETPTVRTDAARRSPANLTTAPAARQPVGALQRWQAELAAGRRDPFTFDDLWRRACAEAEQLEAGRPA